MENLSWEQMSKTAAERGASLSVKIENISPEQAEEFKRMFAWMNALGGWGASRSFKVFYDGDGGARARITVDGEELMPQDNDKEENDGYDNLSFGFE